MLSPRDAAEILNIVGPQVAGADRIHPPTECTPDTDVTGEAHRTDGLVGGEYACYNEAKFHNTKYYETCNFPAAPTVPTAPAPSPTAPDPSPAAAPESSSPMIRTIATFAFGIVAGLAAL